MPSSLGHSERPRGRHDRQRSTQHFRQAIESGDPGARGASFFRQPRDRSLPGRCVPPSFDHAQGSPPVSGGPFAVAAARGLRHSGVRAGLARQLPGGIVQFHPAGGKARSRAGGQADNCADLVVASLGATRTGHRHRRCRPCRRMAGVGRRHGGRLRGGRGHHNNRPAEDQATSRKTAEARRRGAGRAGRLPRPANGAKSHGLHSPCCPSGRVAPPRLRVKTLPAARCRNIDVGPVRFAGACLYRRHMEFGRTC